MENPRPTGAARKQARLAAENERLRTLLRVVDKASAACPVCRSDGEHAAWCSVGAALREERRRNDAGHVFEAGDTPTANPRCARCGEHLRALVARPDPRRCEPTR
jgi:tRNA(Ile2) C34 agmatinyltransferase TiaS